MSRTSSSDGRFWRWKTYVAVAEVRRSAERIHAFESRSLIIPAPNGDETIILPFVGRDTSDGELDSVRSRCRAFLRDPSHEEN